MVLVHLQRLLLIFIGMQLHGVNGARFNDDVSNRLMRFKCATAIDVLTLVITFFGVKAQITAGTGVCCVLAFRAVHHNNHHVIILIRYNHCMLFAKTYIRHYSDLHIQLIQHRRLPSPHNSHPTATPQDSTSSQIHCRPGCASPC